MPKRRHPRMPPHLLILQMILAVTLASGSMLAAAVETPEESPVPQEPQIVDPRWEVRSKHAKDFKSQVLLSRKAIEAGHAAEEKLRTDRAENRLNCRESLRKANRDQRLQKLAGCMHEDLTLTMEMIKERAATIATAPGMSEELRGLIIARSELLTDAMSTIIDALDAGVYQDEEGLQEARKNLREKYLLPYWSLLPRMHAEQSLAWISHLLLKAKALVESPDVTAKILEAEACLVDAETALDSGQSEKELQKINSIISQAQSKMVSCIKLYREAMDIRKKELAPQEEAEQEPQWQKRSLRKLPKSRY